VFANAKLRTFLNNIAPMRGWPMREDTGGAYVLEIPLQTGRSQVVHVTPARDPDNVEIVFFWSTACPINFIADPWALLQENVQLSHASYAIKDGNAIVLTSRLTEHLNIDELTRVLFYVGKYADELEQRLMGPAYDAN